MWILWNKSVCKYLHTLLNGKWECDLFLFMRIWGNNYSNMQCWLSSNHILIIIRSYDVPHVHESQSDGMDHQWFQKYYPYGYNKNDFSLRYITVIHIYSLVREYDHVDHTKRNLIVNENVNCSFSWGYVAKTTVICSIDKVLNASS